MRYGVWIAIFMIIGVSCAMGTTHTISTSGFTFTPDSITIASDDTVVFALSLMHTAREVSKATWDANDTVSNGGFDLPFGGGTAMPSGLGTHYYVCVPHASIGMKGRIVVAAGITRTIVNGWNMISIPVAVSDSSVSTLYPTAVSEAFSYVGRYEPQAHLRNGVGY